MVSANKSGELSDVQGIDNDGAFGLNEHSDFYKASGNNRLIEDDEWNDDTAQALIDQAWDTHREFRKTKDNKNLSQEEQMNVMENSMLNSNYFGEMMLKTMPFPDWNRGIGANPQLLRRKNRNQGK